MFLSCFLSSLLFLALGNEGYDALIRDMKDWLAGLENYGCFGYYSCLIYVALLFCCKGQVEISVGYWINCLFIRMCIFNSEPEPRDQNWFLFWFSLFIGWDQMDGKLSTCCYFCWLLCGLLLGLASLRVFCWKEVLLLLTSQIQEVAILLYFFQLMILTWSLRVLRELLLISISLDVISYPKNWSCCDQHQSLQMIFKFFAFCQDKCFLTKSVGLVVCKIPILLVILLFSEYDSAWSSLTSQIIFCFLHFFGVTVQIFLFNF